MGRNRQRSTGVSAKAKIVAILFCCIGVLTGCVSLIDPESSQDFNSNIIALITPDHSVGQAFVSSRPNFNGVNLWLGCPDSPIPVSVELFHSPNDSISLYQISFQVENGLNKIDFSPQSSLSNQSYYLRLTVEQGEIQVFGREEDNYPYGTAFINDQPIEGDIGFQATYNYELGSILADLQVLLGYWKLFLPLCILLVLPGWILLDLSNLLKDLDIGEQIAFSSGLSIAVTPIIMLWTTVIKLRWSSLSVWVASGMVIMVFIWRIAWKFRQKNIKQLIKSSRSKINSSTFSLFCIFALTLFIRFAMIRDLVVPPWVDPIHHSLITNEIIKTGGYPENYLPHIPSEATKYHAGYHSILAAFHWQTGLEIPKAMLILGQVLNAWSIFGVYLISTSLTKDKKTGLIAALITGFLLVMPAYYLSWGRYTQLTGLLVLPAAMRWMISTPKNKSKPHALVLGGITLAGLFIIHYRVTLFLGCFILAYLIGTLFKYNQAVWKKLASSITSISLMGIVSILFVLPWLIPTLKSFFLPLQSVWIPGSTSIQKIHWNYLTPVFGVPVMVTALLGLLWGSIGIT